MPIFQVISKGKVPAKLWLPDLEASAYDQVVNLSNLPFAFHHVAIMPDAHAGKGTTIGSVLATTGEVVVNCVGVDIGCGMRAKKLADCVPELEIIKAIMGKIRESVPVGFSSRTETPAKDYLFFDSLYEAAKDAGVKRKVVDQFFSKKAALQLGTLGGGNHFIELQTNELGEFFLMIHTGSRNLGKRVAEEFGTISKEINRKNHSSVPPSFDLAFLPAGTEECNTYLWLMERCCRYAELNRQIIEDEVVNAFCSSVLDHGLSYGELERGVISQPSLDVRHNYIAKETHFGQEVLVHRKGAVRARKDEMVIIPGSQGTCSYIARGLGEPMSFESCSHGSGRKMSRSEAKKSLDLESERAKMDALGVVHGIRHESDLDEAPGAYKDIDIVIQNQCDLVEVVTRLTPVGVVKG